MRKFDGYSLRFSETFRVASRIDQFNLRRETVVYIFKELRAFHTLFQLFSFEASSTIMNFDTLNLKYSLIRLREEKRIKHHLPNANNQLLMYLLTGALIPVLQLNEFCVLLLKNSLLQRIEDSENTTAFGKSCGIVLKKSLHFPIVGPIIQFLNFTNKEV